MVNHGPITFYHLNKMLTNIQSIKLKPALKPKFRVLYQPFWSSYGILCQNLRFLLIIINIINYFKRVQHLFFLTRNNKAGVSRARGLEIVYTPAQFLINTKRRKATASSAEQKVELTLKKTDKFMAQNKSTANDYFC